jgi:hypothetical protein
VPQGSPSGSGRTPRGWRALTLRDPHVQNPGPKALASPGPAPSHGGRDLTQNSLFGVGRTEGRPAGNRANSGGLGCPARAGQSRSARIVPGVDDAGGDRRGTRAVVSWELWEVLAARWAIPRQQGRDLGGSLNLNLLVSPGGEQVVVRVHQPSVSPARLEAIEAARDRLDAAGVPCSARVPAHDGARWARAGDRLVEVERYIPHNGWMNTPPRLARGLPILGRIHTLLADAEVCPPGGPSSSPTTSNRVPCWPPPGPGRPGSEAGTPPRRSSAWPCKRSGWPTRAAPPADPRRLLG